MPAKQSATVTSYEKQIECLNGQIQWLCTILASVSTFSFEKDPAYWRGEASKRFKTVNI